jgi:predicted RNA-binding Zn-ribbon protein involved in translation (DUF1610 family)
VPDLSIHNVQVCGTCFYWFTKAKGSGGKEYTVTWTRQYDRPMDAQYAWHCTCPHFVKKLRFSGSECKHIKMHKHECCHWNIEMEPGTEDVDGKCPECGEKTQVVRVGV